MEDGAVCTYLPHVHQGSGWGGPQGWLLPDWGCAHDGVAVPRGSEPGVEVLLPVQVTKAPS